MTKTKILATLGPASFERTEELIKAGADGFRFNMAHVVKPEDYARTADLIKKIRSLDEKIFISTDLEGPKIRLGNFETLNVKIGDSVPIAPLLDYSHGKGIPIGFDLYKFVKGGELLLVDDGKVGLRIKSVDDKTINSVVEYGEVLESRKGINTPGVSIEMPYLSPRDAASLKFIAENDFDYVFASFTRSAKDIQEVRSYLKDSKVKVGGKPENHEGAKNLYEIVREADIMMVPRGDWGMEMGVMNIPALQKDLIRACNLEGKAVITATQMLESMMTSKEPKRAEVSDIFNANLDGTDVVMLSGETSKGLYPVESVKMMDRILEESEKYMFENSTLSENLFNQIPNGDVSSTIYKAVYTAAKSPSVKAIIVPTSRGTTARMIARFRINKPVIAISPNKRVSSQLNALWGVSPLFTEYYGSASQDFIVNRSIKLAKDNGYISSGDNVIITLGIGSYEKGATNMMRIERVE
ncbi:Pyruvate kinase [uncultured archaeon]|nr:Pyruvate kinase [uncultured archaeon]